MVSLVQMRRLGELSQEGWHSVGAPATVETPIGGFSIMMNARKQVIQVNPDGTVIQLGPKHSRGIIDDAHKAIDAVADAYQTMSPKQVKEALLALRERVDIYIAEFEETPSESG